MSRPSDETTVASCTPGTPLDEVRDEPVEVARLRAELDHRSSSGCRFASGDGASGRALRSGRRRLRAPTRLPRAWRVSSSCTRYGRIGSARRPRRRRRSVGLVAQVLARDAGRERRGRRTARRRRPRARGGGVDALGPASRRVRAWQRLGRGVRAPPRAARRHGGAARASGAAGSGRGDGGARRRGGAGGAAAVRRRRSRPAPGAADVADGTVDQALAAPLLHRRLVGRAPGHAARRRAASASAVGRVVRA